MQRLRELYLLGMCACAPLLAGQYAVLVGIGAYRAEEVPNLEGPAHDVEALQRILVSRYGYAPADVTVLRDEKATKANILAALRDRIAGLKAGDQLLFYFSGHGSSAYDPHAGRLAAEIGPDSGALLPYDLDPASLASIAQTLLIGRRDLRPLFSQVPQGARALVLIDSCYSENAARYAGALAAAPVRGVDLLRLADGPSRDGLPSDGPRSSAPPPPTLEAYPYSNVVAVAAASRNQPALDISSGIISEGFRTVDGQPHGAFTNSVLAALLGRGDTNHDGVLTYDELYHFVRRDLEPFPQVPQMLAPAAFSLTLPALGSGKLASKGLPDADSSLPGVRLRVEGASKEIAARSAQVAGVQVVDTGYNLILRQTGHAWELDHASGVPIRSFGLDEPDAVIARIGAEVSLAELIEFRYAGQKFNVTVDVEPENASGYDRYRSGFRVGEPIVLRARTERTAWLLVLDIDKDGYLSVLFPGPSAADQGPQSARREVRIGGLKVQPPEGTERIKVFAFPQEPEGWRDWVCTNRCPEFGPADRRMQALLKMVRGARGLGAEASLRLTTYE